MSTSEIISLTLGGISIILGTMGVFLFHYFENIKSKKMGRYDLLEVKMIYDQMINVLRDKDKKHKTWEKVSIINIFKQSVIHSRIVNTIKWELVAIINLVYSKFQITEFVKQKKDIKSLDHQKQVFEDVVNWLEDIPWIEDNILNIEMTKREKKLIIKRKKELF